MLILCTLPIPMYPGTYECRPETLQNVVKACRSADRLVSCIHALETAELMSDLTGLDLPCKERPNVPPPMSGDEYFVLRLAQGRKRAGQALRTYDLEFLRVTYTEAS